MGEGKRYERRELAMANFIEIQVNQHLLSSSTSAFLDSLLKSVSVPGLQRGAGLPDFLALNLSFLLWADFFFSGVATGPACNCLLLDPSSRWRR